MTKQECYEKIIDSWQDLKWSSYEDTKDARQEYRAECFKKHEKQQKKEEKKQKQKRPRKRHAPEEPAADADPESDAGEDARKLVGASKLRRSVRQEIAEEQKGSRGARCSTRSDDGPLQSLGTRRSSNIAEPKALAQVLDLGRNNRLITDLDDDAREVSVPVAKLKLIQQSWQRAEHAITASLLNNAEQGQKLMHERLIILNAIDVLSELTGEPTRHCGERSNM